MFPKCQVPQSTVIVQSGVTCAFLSTALPRYPGLESPLPRARTCQSSWWGEASRRRWSSPGSGPCLSTLPGLDGFLGSPLCPWLPAKVPRQAVTPQAGPKDT